MLTRGQPVVHEVNALGVIRCGEDRQGDAGHRQSLPAPPPDGQHLEAVELLDPFMIDEDPLTSEPRVQPVVSQRSLAESLGVSLNYVVRALLARGLVAMQNAGRNPRRIGYVYLLTSKGLTEKARLNRRYFKRNV